MISDTYSHAADVVSALSFSLLCLSRSFNIAFCTIVCHHIGSAATAAAATTAGKGSGNDEVAQIKRKLKTRETTLLKMLWDFDAEE